MAFFHMKLKQFVKIHLKEIMQYVTYAIYAVTHISFHQSNLDQVVRKQSDIMQYSALETLRKKWYMGKYLRKKAFIWACSRKCFFSTFLILRISTKIVLNYIMHYHLSVVRRITIKAYWVQFIPLTLFDFWKIV